MRYRADGFASWVGLWLRVPASEDGLFTPLLHHTLMRVMGFI